MLVIADGNFTLRHQVQFLVGVLFSPLIIGYPQTAQGLASLLPASEPVGSRYSCNTECCNIPLRTCGDGWWAVLVQNSLVWRADVAMFLFSDIKRLCCLLSEQRLKGLMRFGRWWETL